MDNNRLMMTNSSVQVVVLSEGRVVEAGHPHLLLQAVAAAGTAAVEHQESGMSASGKVPSEVDPIAAKATLSSMVDETGPASSEHLRRLAREAWEGSKMGANQNPGTAVA